MILYIIIIIILYILFIIGLYIIYSSTKLNSFICSMNTILLKLFLFKSIRFNPSSLLQYYSYLKSNKPLIIVSNHRALFDSIVLMSIFGNISFVINDKGMSLFPGVNIISDKLHFIKMKLNKKTNSTQQIIDYSINRQINQPILTIFPDSLDEIPQGLNIAPFKTGAFVGKIDILPVVIKYKNYDVSPYYWGINGVRGMDSMYEKLLDYNCDINIDILPVIHPDDSLSIIEYKDLVYNIMNKHYDTM